MKLSKWFVLMIVCGACFSAIILCYLRKQNVHIIPQIKNTVEKLNIRFEPLQSRDGLINNSVLGFQLSSWLRGMPQHLDQCVVNVSSLKEEIFHVSENMTVGEIWRGDVRNVKYGGNYAPRYCTNNESLAVIIPYRDREKYLELQLNSLHHLLQRQNCSYTIFVVEMALPTQFNRGFLLNVGYLTARRLGNYNCFVFHDVDLIPVNERNLYKCGPTPTHLAQSVSKYPKGVPYASFIGGIVMFTSEQFSTINGFSNAYFGWGGEDDDLEIRVKANKMTVKRATKLNGRYFALAHGSDTSNPENPQKLEIFKSIRARMKEDGLNSLKFKLLALEFRPLYTWIHVKTNESEIMKYIP